MQTGGLPQAPLNDEEQKWYAHYMSLWNANR